ncbi:NmrA family NAD(P)-binding protein [Georgenia yuyongxinii]|uniref:SDR family NAD(P)-dependent oxidoreductase n=1 Tax=Georgenia yuyongxinii TaxID=2589797 RepID=A0A552WV23_9MICO|nr:NmrA family NAD(P)-binding protein [Georgenia yuyongxinii]TRW46691.1 SDR family NAD(P)-dependent oxidoreductase [Georgenia yuyongxinii]
MSGAPILVSGPSGNVGRTVVAALVAAGADVRAASRDAHAAGPVRGVRFDFTDPTTWPAAFAGVEAMFVVRPPALGNAKRDIIPALTAARDAGVRHMVLLSLQGAERNHVVPHAAIERWLRTSGLSWTFVRASFFHQNLSTTHVADVRDRDEIVVPAGRGTTAFVDAEDVGAVVAAALLDRAHHANRAWTVTGSEALSYDDVARILIAELGRPIRYARPGALRYARHARRVLHMPWPMVAVTAAIYTTARLGLAGGLTDDVRTVLGREPVTFSQFAHRERAAWARPDQGEP